MIWGFERNGTEPLCMTSGSHILIQPVLSDSFVPGIVDSTYQDMVSIVRRKYK